MCVCVQAATGPCYRFSVGLGDKRVVIRLCVDMDMDIYDDEYQVVVARYMSKHMYVCMLLSMYTHTYIYIYLHIKYAHIPLGVPTRG